jgi:hypothetical protein
MTDRTNAFATLKRMNRDQRVRIRELEAELTLKNGVIAELEKVIGSLSENLKGDGK